MQEELRSLAINISSRVNSDEGISKEVEGSYPFLKYSSMELLAHAESAQAEGISQISLLRQLEKRRNYETLQLWEYNWVELDKSLKGAQLLYRVSREGYYYLVQTLLLETSADVNSQGGYYSTALQVGVRDGTTDIVELLLKYGADVNAQGGKYGTALQAATAYEIKRLSRYFSSIGLRQLHPGLYEPKGASDWNAFS